MTDADLLAHPEFLAACSQWQETGRALPYFADWFADRGMEEYAAAWEWASLEVANPTAMYIDGIPHWWWPVWWLPVREICWPPIISHPSVIIYFLSRYAVAYPTRSPDAGRASEGVKT